MTETKAYRTWQDRLDTGRLTKAQIGQFAQAVKGLATGGMVRGKATNLTTDEAQALVCRLRDNPVLLTSEHTEQGLTWLERHGAKALDMPADVHDYVISHFWHFSWDGETVEYGDYRNAVYPVWTVHLTSGRVLAYWYAPWVSGVNESGWRWERQ